MGKVVTRKEFLGSSAAFAATPFVWGGETEASRPSMRLGMISDVHLVLKDNGKGLQNSLCFEPALRYLDKRKADGVLIAGDLTDFGTASALRYLASIWKKGWSGWSARKPCLASS